MREYNHFNSYSVPVSVKGVVFENGEVWLRKNERSEWELPGGKIEEGEQPNETVIREMREELGFEVEISKLTHVWMYMIKKSVDESQGVLVISYLCKLLSKTGIFEVNGEAGKSEFEKFSLDKIDNLNMPYFYKEAIHLAWTELNK